MKYKPFGKHTGLLASEIVLGAASMGTRRGHGSSPAEARNILADYVGAGGNFIDIADQYQLGEAEEIVGEFISDKRSNLIICTKYTRSNESSPSPANSGNHRKAMRQAIEGSLKRLKTDYIDIYMPHFDDGITSTDEISRGLQDLLSAGKILYAGLANFPAWKAAVIAKDVPLAAVQIEYNLLQRTPDRELIPMADNFGAGKMFYSPLAGGVLTGKYRKGEAGRITLNGKVYEEDAATKQIIDQLEQIAVRHNATPGEIALAWVLTRDAFPILGARTLQHLQNGLKAISIPLSAEEITGMDQLSQVSLGYPGDLLAAVRTKSPGN